MLDVRWGGEELTNQASPLNKQRRTEKLDRVVFQFIPFQKQNVTIWRLNSAFKVKAFESVCFWKHIHKRYVNTVFKRIVLARKNSNICNL
jgi:hypothetical protein